MPKPDTKEFENLIGKKHGKVLPSEKRKTIEDIKNIPTTSLKELVNRFHNH